MGVLTWLGLREARTDVTQVRATAAEAEVEILRESLADLELAMEDRGWTSLTLAATAEFSRDGLGKIADVCRVLAVAHPLIKRGLNVRQSYVWGGGVTITGRAVGDDGEEDVNGVVQAFLDDEGNRAAFTGEQAHEENERALGTDGNVFIAHFTNPRTGFVQARTIPFAEIVDVITNPEDRDDPWFYHRRWTERRFDDAGRLTTAQREALYPALTHHPRVRPKRLSLTGTTQGGVEVVWDAPVLHVSVNRLDGWAFGIGDAYAAVAWARMHRDFLTDWATLMKSLSQFAWRATTEGSKAQKLRQALQRRPAGPAPVGNDTNAGATSVLPTGTTLEAIPKSGATIDADSGKPLASYIAAALGLPVTVLLADPGQTGARAVAETLDRPTENEMNLRRALWANAYRSSLAYVIRQAVKAPQGPLRGTITRDPFTGREAVELAGDTDATIEVDWPPLDDVDMETLVKAIAEADRTGKMPPEQVARLLLLALRVKDVDDVLEDFLDEDGRFIDPYTSAGQAAVDAFRRGEDPAAVV